ncbi:hypothetical protein FPQ18DRAFT_25159 [Pyronema domesticum]|nr:hypothetical protein FPQ18DRAFT_25159 [Pyronema domesticum]
MLHMYWPLIDQRGRKLCYNADATFIASHRRWDRRCTCFPRAGRVCTVLVVLPARIAAAAGWARQRSASHPKSTRKRLHQTRAERSRDTGSAGAKQEDGEMEDDDVTGRTSLRTVSRVERALELKYERQEPPAESPSSGKEPLIPPFFHQLPAEHYDKRPSRHQETPEISNFGQKSSNYPKLNSNTRTALSLSSSYVTDIHLSVNQLLVIAATDKN